MRQLIELGFALLVALVFGNLAVSLLNYFHI